MSEEIRHSNPFTVPEGYFSELEDRLREIAVTPEPEHVGWLAKVKPAIMLTLMFGVIAGFGWVVSKVTGLLYTDPVESDDPITAMIEEGWIDLLSPLQPYPCLRQPSRNLPDQDARLPESPAPGTWNSLKAPR